ncbi:uncharacterized protein DSM5745_05344 [Aspergillus mulundensis]|uniref:Uncharacterized protein n=1 Tax=Aspergillus mulundensis TaxID=1810919 RepID=A0A3D8S646_9EURO|nr:Uncharacterized protein DSM5745_05344 [Aspergillus mulundensis]RDW81787.1 Uncharacterized protein DSM5745_05344 [Aspergillus mulundensis]
MSNPLSPLADSQQNSRAPSSNFEDAREKLGGSDSPMTASLEIENPLFSPKRILNTEIRQSFGHDGAGCETRAEGNEDVLSVRDLQSSPFRPDGRDDTVDIQMLRRYQTLNNATTPMKRSYDQAPDIHDIEGEENDRHKRSAPQNNARDIDIYVDEDSRFSHDQSAHEGMSTVLREEDEETSPKDADETNDATIDDEDIHDPMDDTCFSTFSAVPNVDMTAFANLRGGSPFKSPRPLPDFPVDADAGDSKPATPSPKESWTIVNMSSPIGSPTPRKREIDEPKPSDTPNLLDFTDNIDLFPRRQRYIMQQQDRYSPSRRSPLKNPRSPAKTSLLDFDIPAAPTPRSIPTVTPRELETLKSNFLSEISSLKATLSGKEAEVSSLKKAVSDAERRVGEALEEVRNEAARKETLEIEQAGWQRRGREMEDVLRTVKADILEGEQERERLQKKNDETEKRKDQLEHRIVELESQLTAARKSAVCEHMASETSETAIRPAKTAEETAKEIQDAVEKVARDLHSLYKEKHEIKVAALKKSYEARWEKRLREVEKKLKAANEECEQIKTERDAALQESSRTDASVIAHGNEEHESEKHVLLAQITALQQEITTLKGDAEQLRADLKAERTEKGDLVALVEEWLSMQPQQPAPSPPSIKNEEMTPEPVHEQLPPAEDVEHKITRGSSSGLRGPSSSSSSTSSHGEKRIPRFGAPAGRHVRGTSAGKSGIAVFTPGRSGIMGSIERMGRGGAA